MNAIAGFSVTLKVVSPAFVGGANGKVDQDTPLRGASIRGLMHTWARAALGPLSDDSPQLRDFESALLGGGAGSGFLPVFRIRITPTEEFVKKGKYLLPRDGRVNFEAWVSGTIRADIRARRASISKAHMKALAGVTWLSFALGSIGKRSRRGYGSLLLTGLSGAGDPGLPVFRQTDTAEILRKNLEDGVRKSLELIRTWTGQTGSHSDLPGFFQLGGCRRVYLGAHASGLDTLLKNLMNTMHQLKSDSPHDFNAQLGSAIGTRRPSPLWFRVYPINSGKYRLLATWSPQAAGSKGDTLVKQALRDLKMKAICEDARKEQR